MKAVFLVLSVLLGVASGGFSEEKAAAPESSAIDLPAAVAEVNAAPSVLEFFGPPAPPRVAIEIDLTAQKAWVVEWGQRIIESPVSTGRAGYETPRGNFKITEKDIDHKSTLYGKIVDSRGRVLVADASSSTPVPPGARFDRAPMRYFLRFNGAVGMHAGRLPGYPASHGCVRLPATKAAEFFKIVDLGTPVRVFGKTPTRGPVARPVRKAPAATPAPTPKPRRWGPWFARK
jgi:hypothetical protein